MKDFKKLLYEKRVENWKEKQMYRQFIRDMPEDTDGEKLWLWFRKQKKPVQEQTIRTNYVKYHIHKSVDSPFCRMCGETGKTISHIIRECSTLSQREYKRRHDNVARMVH